MRIPYNLLSRESIATETSIYTTPTSFSVLPTSTILPSIIPRDDTTSTDLPTAISEADVTPTTTATATATELALAGSLTTSSSSSSSSTTSLATASATSSSTSDSSSGNTTTIIGVVVGVLGTLLIVGLIAYFITDRKKKQSQRARLAEKNQPQSPRSPATANGPTPVRPARPTGPGSSIRNAPSVPAKDHARNNSDPSNPFGNNAEKLHAPESANPFADNVSTTPVAPLARKASRRAAPNQLDLTLPQPPRVTGEPASPTGSDYSVSLVPDGSLPHPTAGSAAIAAAGGPATSAVHRVKLEFTPSLQDELELQPGQLVRLLHEYDDGWALVIRLDRSAQGVVPRTCLSQQPVKPRTGGKKPPVSMNNVRPSTRDGPVLAPSEVPGQAY